MESIFPVVSLTGSALLLFKVCFGHAAAIPASWQKLVDRGAMLVNVGADEPNVTAAATIGNGFMAYSMASDFFYVAGVYNGPAQSANPSHRAAIPNPQMVDVPGELQYSGLNLEDGTYTRVYILPGSKCVVTQVQYAHRLYRGILVQSITVDNTHSTETCFVEFDSPDVSKSPDFSAPTVTTTSSYTINSYTTLISEQSTTPLVTVAVVSFPPDPDATVLAGQTQTLYLYTTVSTTLQGTDPADGALGLYNMIVAEDYHEVFEMNHFEWTMDQLGRIEIGGNLALAQVVNSSYFYLLTSLAPRTHWSVSPGGLASNAYNGHVFWDAETWMYPPVLFFHPEYALGCFLQYRLNHLAGARLKAQSYGLGYQGTMFPWESAASGIETCPTTAPTGELEQHISGDISLATRQYYYTSGDPMFLKQYLPLIEGVGQFWVSRVKPSTKRPGKYDINGVIPPDEFAVNVNNSAYTNQVAKISLDWLLEVYNILGLKDTIGAARVSEGLWIPFDEKNQVHLEYEGYNGAQIKQADVVMLSYPLETNMTTAIQKNDLAYYQQRIAEGGPAMTWAMHTIGWLDLNQTDRAAELFARSYANSHAPFGVWTETPTGGATNFLTGAGGFLQALINGYGGARIGRFSYSFKPQLPPNTASMAFRRVVLLGNEFDLFWDAKNIQITVQRLPIGRFVSLLYQGHVERLVENQPVYLPAGSSFTLQAGILNA